MIIQSHNGFCLEFVSVSIETLGLFGSISLGKPRSGAIIPGRRDGLVPNKSEFDTKNN